MYKMIIYKKYQLFRKNKMKIVTNDILPWCNRPSVLKDKQPQPWQEHAQITTAYIAMPNKLQPTGWDQYNNPAQHS